MAQFPCLVEKLEDGDVLGTGYAALANNLQHRMDKLNRNSVIPQKIENVKSPITRKQDCYGCYIYKPQMTVTQLQLETDIVDQ